MTVKSKHKGNAFERKICTELSLWWTDGKNDNVFWKTSNSGGRATTRRKNKKTALLGCGDIEAVDPIGKPLIDAFTFELKKGYNDDSFADLLDAPATAKQQQYAKWFTKIEQEHKLAKSYTWALIVQRDRRLPLICMPLDVEEIFDNMWPVVYMYGDKDNVGIVITHLSNFYRISPKKIAALGGGNGTDKRNKK
jgi:hypothetical protein